MSLLGKKGGLLTIPDPSTRKEKMIQRLLKEAVKQGDSVMVDFVLCKCWDKERIFTITCDQDGSLLHLATDRNFRSTVRVLLQHGINVDNRNQDGDTSLHIAAINGYREVLDLLFESGCNPFIENSVGKQAIDCIVNDNNIKQKLRLYSVRCSRVKLMKTLETWKNIVEEDEKIGLSEQEKSTTVSATSITIITPPASLKRSDSGIISDFDSDKSSSRASINSTVSKTANLVSLQSTKETILNIPQERERKTSEKRTGRKISKSLSFNVKDITNQYNNVTAALRKISSQGKHDLKPSEILTDLKSQKSDRNPPKEGKDTKNNQKVSKDSKNHQEDNEKDKNKTGRKISGGGLRVSSLYGEPKKTSKCKKKIDRSQRMSLPLLPIFAPPESYI